MKRIVIDASVALKWFLPDEDHGERALGMLDAHVSGRIAFFAPALLEFEVANGLVIAARRGRVGENEILNAIDGFTGLGIGLYSVSPFFSKVFTYCKKFNITAYDASYIALADEMKTQVVTADKRLFNSTRKLNIVKWIGEF